VPLAEHVDGHAVRPPRLDERVDAVMVGTSRGAASIRREVQIHRPGRAEQIADGAGHAKRFDERQDPGHSAALSATRLPRGERRD
jgi:hypothetical protein